MGINEVWRPEVQSYETLGILAEFHNVFLLELSVPLLAIFLDFLSPLSNGQWCPIYRQGFVNF